MVVRQISGLQPYLLQGYFAHLHLPSCWCQEVVPATSISISARASSSLSGLGFLVCHQIRAIHRALKMGPFAKRNISDFYNGRWMQPDPARSVEPEYFDQRDIQANRQPGYRRGNLQGKSGRIARSTKRLIRTVVIEIISTPSVKSYQLYGQHAGDFFLIINR